MGATGPVTSNEPALALAGERSGVRIAVAVGVHPHNADTLDDAALATLTRMAAAPGVVAVGETGLDYYYEHSPRDAQRTAFARTVALARSVGLPLVVHVRDAHADAVGGALAAAVLKTASSVLGSVSRARGRAPLQHDRIAGCGRIHRIHPHVPILNQGMIWIERSWNPFQSCHPV